MGRIVESLDSFKQVAQNDPWKSNDNEAVYFANIDLDAPENAHPKQQLDSDECISIVTMNVKGLCKSITEYAKEKKCEIDTGVWAFAVGMEFAHLKFPH